MSIQPSKLLLIEPNPDDAELTSRILIHAFEQCQVCIASDVVSYAKYYADGEFSSVISELDLGWSSGTEVLASFAERYPGTRLFLFTNELPQNIEHLRNKLGLAGYAAKNSAGFLNLPDLVSGTSEDAHAHEVAEICWSQTLEKMEEPSFTVSRNGIILEANRAAAYVSGYSQPDELIDTTLSEVLHVAQGPLPGEDNLLRMIQKLGRDGSERLELMVAPAKDPLQVGRKKLVAWPILNSSRIAIIYHSLKHSDKGTGSAGDEGHRQAYTDLLYAVSHDLQEPLQLVYRHAKLLQDTYSKHLDSSGKRFIDNLISSSSQMQSMLDDLLEFSRLGRMASMVTEVDLNAVVKDVVTMFQPKLAEIGGQVRWEELPKLLADRGQMTRLFQNLIGNAIKFHSDDPLDVSIRSRIKEDCVEFVVKDNGIGIEPSNEQTIFGMFKRLHTHGEYPGNGMGLAVCRRVVNLHKGEIWARPRAAPKRGLAVHFTLCSNNP